MTGGGGFLGSALVRELKRRGHHVRVLLRKGESDTGLSGLDAEIFTGDILDKTSLAEPVKGIDIVFHAAALYKSYPFFERHPNEIYRINVEGTRNVFESALAAGVKKVIHTSSIAAVGKPLGHYGKSKALAEEIALSYHRKGMHVVSVNPGFIFGAGEAGPDSTGELIVRFLNGFYRVYFDAALYISDLEMTVEAHLKAMEIGKNGERYIVVSERAYTLKEIFAILEEITGIKAPRIKIPIWLVLMVSMIHELLIGLFGLTGRMRPIIASEIAKYYMLNPKYDGTKARTELGLKEPQIRETFEKAVRWCAANGYTKKPLKRI